MQPVVVNYCVCGVCVWCVGVCVVCVCGVWCVCVWLCVCVCVWCVSVCVCVCVCVHLTTTELLLFTAAVRRAKPRKECLHCTVNSVRVPKDDVTGFTDLCERYCGGERHKTHPVQYLLPNGTNTHTHTHKAMTRIFQCQLLAVTCTVIPLSLPTCQLLLKTSLTS